MPAEDRRRVDENFPWRVRVKSRGEDPLNFAFATREEALNVSSNIYNAMVSSAIVAEVKYDQQVYYLHVPHITWFGVQENDILTWPVSIL